MINGIKENPPYDQVFGDIEKGNGDPSLVMSGREVTPTMELILGLPPLSQFDAAARPMSESFTDVADLTPYDHPPARIDLNARNTPLAYGAAVVEDGLQRVRPDR